MGDGTAARRDAGIGDVTAHNVGHIGDGRQFAAADVNVVVQIVRQRGADEYLGGVLRMDHRRRFQRVKIHTYRLPNRRQGHHQAANHPRHSGNPPVSKHRADANAPQVQPVQRAVTRGGKIVHRLGHPVHIDGRGQVILSKRTVAESILDAVHGDAAGIDDALDAAPAGRLKDIVSPVNVDGHSGSGALLGVGRQQRRHMDDAVNSVLIDGL